MLARVVWSLVQGTLFRWTPAPLHFVRVYLLKLFGAQIREPLQVTIYPTARVVCPWNLTLDTHSVVGPNVMLYCLGEVRLCRGATVSQNCHICSGTHDFNRWDMPLVTKSIVIGENAWLGADTYVGPGVSIGELCVVGARSVVVRDLPAQMICVGHPCRPIKVRQAPAR